MRQNAVRAAVVFQVTALTVVGGQPGTMTKAKQTAAKWVDKNSKTIQEASKTVWEYAEIALKEHKSAKLLSGMLEDGGFKVERGVSDMPSAFVAEYGSGKPVVTFLAEYDALPGLSQKVKTFIDPIVEGAGGHGCGHSLFGAGTVGGALALKSAMDKHKLKGTIRVYGTPAEEQVVAKVFMVRDGLFDNVDVCFDWHPSSMNRVSVLPSKALRSFEVTFYGRSAHASGAPWEGVSALDAVEAFETGVNLLREHMPTTGRIHYVVTQGGGAPNVIPAKASVWMYNRAKDWPEVMKIYRHVETIVKAADMMAWGEEYGNPKTGFKPAEIDMLTGVYEYNHNHEVAKIVHANLSLVGAPKYTKSEEKFARDLQETFGVEVEGYHSEVADLNLDPPRESGGSTDVANISWVTPTAGFGVSNWPQNIPAHSWASTAASGSEPGLKAMLNACKVLAFNAIDVMTDPSLLDPVRKEFSESVEAFDYDPPVGSEVKPTLPSHMRE
ncbi:MAG: amidohydrolase [Candidatus Neomarinimicrobiota bacterium]|nr:amidohydrolase [Candidatus Neomarinimicrobiota bacterium]